MRNVLFVWFWVFVSAFSTVFAGEYIDFSMSKNLFSRNSEITVIFDLSENAGYFGSNYLRARPRSKNGSIQIYNNVTQKWVGENSGLTEYPFLDDGQVRIRSDVYSFDKTLLKFELYDLNSGEVLLTEEKPIWGYRSYLGYNSLLNEGISLGSDHNDEIYSGLESTVELDGKDKTEPLGADYKEPDPNRINVKIMLILVAVLVIVFGTAFSYVLFRKKQKLVIK